MLHWSRVLAPSGAYCLVKPNVEETKLSVKASRLLTKQMTWRFFVKESENDPLEEVVFLSGALN